MNDKRKKFVVPEAELINFCEDDVIATSGFMVVSEDESLDDQDGDNY